LNIAYGPVDYYEPNLDLEQTVNHIVQELVKKRKIADKRHWEMWVNLYIKVRVTWVFQYQLLFFNESGVSACSLDSKSMVEAISRHG